ncbi:MAG: PAS domain-containing sensor histidine kinase [Anaerolineales bacterium]|nr:PAS domain-containing sensor histidine kinase [Anaerolineales bacterium]
MTSALFQEGVISTDEAGLITVYDPGAETILGYSADEALGQPVHQILRVQEHFSWVDGQTLLSLPSGNYSLKDKNDRIQHLHILNTRPSAAGTGLPRFFLLVRDLSDDEEVEGLRESFLASISQEFRTPLAAINASVELLLEQHAEMSGVEVSALLNSIHMSVFGLQMMIDNVLESMKVEAGSFKIHKELADLGDVIDDAVLRISPLLDRRGQSVQMKGCDALPALWMDRSRITQAVVNLLSNSSKHNPIGMPIDLWVENEGSEGVRVMVADRGSGVSLKDKDRVFERFACLEDRDEPRYGIGLGLSIVREVVEAHGGEVGVGGREEGGSVFWFKLPYNREGNR